MRQNIINQWNPPEYWESEFFDVIKSMKHTHHHVLLPQEIQPYHFHEEKYNFTNSLVKLLNSKITFYIGAEIQHPKFSNIDFVYWSSMIYESKKFLKHNITKFTSMTNVKPGRPWRHYIFDKLYQLPIDLSNVIYNFSLDYNDDILNDNKYNTLFTPNVAYDSHQRNIGDIQYSVETQYHYGIIDIICETYLEHFFPTEKTTRAIFYKKPFLVVGCHHFHSKLEEEFGIKKFDIFDYTFDDVENDIQRIDMYLNELQRINEDYTKEYILEKTNSETIKNYLQFERISHFSYRPQYLNDYFWEHID